VHYNSPKLGWNIVKSKNCLITPVRENIQILQKALITLKLTGYFQGLSIDFLFTLFLPYLCTVTLLEIWISIYRYFDEGLNFQSDVFLTQKCFNLENIQGVPKKKYKKKISKTIPDPAAKIWFQNCSVIFNKFPK